MGRTATVGQDDVLPADGDDADAAVHLHAEPVELALGAAGQARLFVAQLRQHRGTRVDEVDAAAADRRRAGGQGGGQLDAGEPTADDHEVGGLASRGRVLEEDEAGRAGAACRPGCAA